MVVLSKTSSNPGFWFEHSDYQSSTMGIFDNYYYVDSSYQLELNLQSIRRELISVLEEFEKRDCTTCEQLKCRCSDAKPAPAQTDSGRNSQASCKSSHSKHDQTPTPSKSHTPKEAPPADVLPKPKWDEAKAGTPQTSTPEKSTKDKDAWLRAVTTALSTVRHEHDLSDSAYGVEAFFRSFKSSTLSHSSSETNISSISSRQ